MVTPEMTALLIGKLESEHPGKVDFVDDEALEGLRADPVWGKVGSYPVGTSDFLRPCRHHLEAGREIIIVSMGGRSLHVYAKKRKKRRKNTARRDTNRHAAGPTRSVAPTPMLRGASGLEARPSVGPSAFCTYLKDLSEAELVDGPRADADERVEEEFHRHLNTMLTTPVHTSWPVFAYAFRHGRVRADEFQVSFFLFPKSEPKRQTEAIGQLHFRAMLGDNAPEQAWVEGSGLVFDRQGPRLNATDDAPMMALELGEASDDELAAAGGGSMSLQLLFQEATDKVQEEDQEAESQRAVREALRSVTGGPNATQKATDQVTPATNFSSNQGAGPPANNRAYNIRIIVGFTSVVLLFVVLVGLRVKDNREEQTIRMTAATLQAAMADPFKEEPLEALPVSLMAGVTRVGDPTLMGTRTRIQVDPQIDATLPRLRHCYHKHLLANVEAPASGKLEIKLVINLNGDVHQVGPGHSELWDESLRNCSVEAFRDLRFAKTESTSATSGTYTFAFNSAPPTADAP